jgi:L-ascorbate oxidase
MRVLCFVKKCKSFADFILLPGNTYDANHPFHLHGHSFHVMAVEKLGSNTSRQDVKNYVESGKVRRNGLYAPVKDTVTIPDGGFSLLRVKASNPGILYLHTNFCT